ncbi:MAG TPA: prepilin-type N-terminal cleavage/methylation domain-containing protein [Fimbriimonadaceae bacterium]|nr:prepilin-type N-terminal cleavage/methylation domain-containing protein [Fimbriimonadaceae bacterium]
MSRAFTLIEVIVVVAIIAIVASIGGSVILRAREGGLQTKSISNMRQVYLAIQQYRDEQSAVYGDMYAMGLPPGTQERWLPVSKWAFSPKCPAKVKGFSYLPIPKDEDRRSLPWFRATEEFGDRVVLLADPWFNPPPPRGSMYEQYWMDPYAVKYAFGLNLGGALQKRTRSGLLDLEWWL